MSIADPSSKLITADELLKMGDIGRCELLHGELIMMSPAGAEHGVVAARLARFLAAFVEDNNLGIVFGAETGFKLDTDPDTVRAADASYVRLDRVKDGITKKFFEGPPDLAVEVRSPDDSRREVIEKVNYWLAKGTTSVWVADPKAMDITIYQTGKDPVVFGRDQVLRDGAILPGFELPVASVYRLL
jgi:Uma2 family endonuclease